MKTTITTLSLFLALTTWADERNYPVTPFTCIDASSAVTVSYSVSSKCSVRGQGRAQDLAHYKVSCEDGRLVISFDEKTRKMHDININKVTFHVTGPANVREIEVSGASRFETSNTLDTPAITIEASGASSVSCKAIAASDVRVDCSGASNVTCKKMEASSGLELDVSGASHFEGRVKGDEIDIDCSGASHCTLDVQCTTVRADASGLSRIALTGKARHVKTDTSGLSKIDRRGLKSE